MPSISNKRGFTLVVSALLVSAVLLTVAAAAASVVRAREASDTTYANFLQARAAASSCMDVALLKRKLDSTYLGNETISTLGFSCTIRPIVSGATPVFETEAIVSGSVYRLRVQATTSDGFVVTSWDRVTSF